jgi:hypothetical protein
MLQFNILGALPPGQKPSDGHACLWPLSGVLIALVNDDWWMMNENEFVSKRQWTEVLSQNLAVGPKGNLDYDICCFCRHSTPAPPEQKCRVLPPDHMYWHNHISNVNVICLLTYNIMKNCHVYEWLQTGFIWVIGFSDNLQTVTTSNYSAIANSHTLQFTRTRTMSFSLHQSLSGKGFQRLTILLL